MKRLYAIGIALLLGLGAATAKGADQNMIPEVCTDQDAIIAGEIPVQTLFYRGMHLFSNRFTSLDAYGEAPDGPRRATQNLNDNPALPFLRLNGLDAYSCLECHAHAGMTSRDKLAVARELGSSGGSASISSNVLIFESLAPLRDGLIRNPPHVNGLGYIQRLADEMTADLHAVANGALAEAAATGTSVRRELVSKGISFGHVTATETGGLDRSETTGVSLDLVVRPFQHKGIASSLRNFVSGALNFHFSVQPRELLDRHLIPDDNPTGILADDPRDEVLEGEVTTLSVFLAAMRPPMRDPTGLDAAAVNRGESLFDSVGCTECHVPSLRMNDPNVLIIDPRATDAARRKTDYVSIQKLMAEAPLSMTAIEPDSTALPSMIQAGPPRQSAGYTVNLNDPMLPDEAMPRLAANPDGSVDVPLYSDLRRHRMGSALADPRDQQADVLSIRVTPAEFLTRPLWGVADTGPWLHDGRATTLREAILLHAGGESEANAAIEAFVHLPPADQEALVVFLKSLRLRAMKHPAEPNVMHRQGIVIE